MSGGVAILGDCTCSCGQIEACLVWQAIIAARRHDFPFFVTQDWYHDSSRWRIVPGSPVRYWQRVTTYDAATDAELGYEEYNRWTYERTVVGNPPFPINRNDVRPVDTRIFNGPPPPSFPPTLYFVCSNEITIAMAKADADTTLAAVTFDQLPFVQYPPNIYPLRSPILHGFRLDMTSTGGVNPIPRGMPIFPAVPPLWSGSPPYCAHTASFVGLYNSQSITATVLKTRARVRVRGTYWTFEADIYPQDPSHRRVLNFYNPRNVRQWSSPTIQLVELPPPPGENMVTAFDERGLVLRTA